MGPTVSGCGVVTAEVAGRVVGLGLGAAVVVLGTEGVAGLTDRTVGSVATAGENEGSLAVLALAEEGNGLKGCTCP